MNDAPARDKFCDLLRELFQFEHSAGLDFGIYRIMNYKRAVIEDFINRDLADAVSETLRARLHDARELQSARLLGAQSDLLKSLGEDAVDENNELAEAFRSTPAGKAYLKAYQQAGALPSHAQLEENAFNRLYDFFSRYYEDGDFVSKRRYSRRARYAIPYNGDEVHLHWANRDQYYIKTGERFLHYAFHHGGHAVRFELRDADVEKDNRKGEARFFFPLAQAVSCDESNIVIPFVFRPLEKDDKNGDNGNGNGNGRQEAILKEALPGIEKKLSAQAKAALLAADGDGDDNSTVLEKHMRRYARRNTADYFIHKDLHGFLSQELDFFIKNEVLDLDDLEQAGEFASEGRFHLMQTVRECGVKIIEFLAQIENFQKQLFEKKKFVIDTHYCVAVGRIADASLRKEILSNKAQWVEWGAMSGGKINGAKARQDFLRGNPTLMVDTAYFGAEFKDQLLAQFADIDGECDGVLLSGENFQGLNLLAEKYRGRVKCVYIDPPYNTGPSEILYKNSYKHSSWMSLMADRCALSREMISADGTLACAIDDEEFFNLKSVLDLVFGSDNYISPLVFESNPRGRTTDSFFATCHDYVLIYGKNAKQVSVHYMGLTKEQESLFKLRDDVSAYRLLPFRRSGGLSTPDERPNSFYPIFYSQKTGKIDVEEFAGSETIYPIDRLGKKRVWRQTKPSLMKAVQAGEIVIKTNHDKFVVYLKDRQKEGRKPKTIFSDAKYDTSSHGTVLLMNIIGEKEFSYPKSLHAVKDTMQILGAGEKTALVADFFAGSGTTGHAVINLNREDGGRRKFILMEMGEYFDSVLLPRLKKIAWTPEWKDGKPKRVATTEETARAPRMFKYHRIESYEDALENIAFTDPDSEQTALKFPDYLLSYMLQWETRDSKTYLNTEKLQTPFDYQLRLRLNGDFAESPVDVAETFNYLLGLHVETRKIYQNGKHRYLVYTGRVENRQAAVLWRNTAGWSDKDFERDRDFVAKNKLTAGADVVYVNNDSLAPGAESLDGVFKGKLLGEMDY